VERIAPKKLHFAPFVRQKRALDRLIREGRFDNPTEFLRRAIDHYLDQLGRPTLGEQARLMAEDLRRDAAATLPDAGRMQAASMESDETW